MSTPTTNLVPGLDKPQVGGDGNNWGSLLNGDLDRIDSMFPAGTVVASSQIVIKNSTTGNAVVGVLSIAKAVANSRLVQFFTGATAPVAGLRWTAGADGVAEGGLNAGSNFIIQPFDDSGNALTAALQINRANQVVTFPQIPVAAGASLLTTATVNSFSMVGEIRMWAGAGDPAGGNWLICDGRSFPTTTFPALFGLIGTSYGGSGGAYNIPDLRQRIAVGGLGTLADPGRISATTTPGFSNTIAAVFGEGAHALATPELAAHNHGVIDPGHKHTITPMRNNAGVSNTSNNINVFSPAAPGGSTSTDIGAGTFGGDPAVGTGITLASTGAGAGHNNVQPSIVLNYIIRVQ